jgi:uncharacterized protein DUF1559
VFPDAFKEKLPGPIESRTMSSTPFRCLCFLLFILRPLALPSAAKGQATRSVADKASVVAPFIDEQTLVIGRIELAKIDPGSTVKLLSQIAPAADRSRLAGQAAEIEQKAKEILHVLAQAGVVEIYGVVSLADMPKEPLFVVAPIKAGSDAGKAAGVLRQVLHFEQSDVRPGVVILGKQSTIERLKTLRPTPRPELAKGFERAGDSAAQLILSPGDDARRVLRETLPRLPDEIGGGSGKMLADGLQWAVVTADAPPEFSLHVLIQSKDADSAVALRGTIVSALQFVGKQEEIRRHWPQFDDLARMVTPQLVGDKLAISISGRRVEELFTLLGYPLQAARISAGRSQSMNHLKQLGLAMHNYHDVHGRFPPQAIRSKDGKALLSWRVAILPYLEADPLYGEFHLDEPWDSEHNQKLIAKMPAVLASPSLGDELRAKGMTSYLVPLTRQPPAVAIPQLEDPKKPIENGKDEMVFDLVQGTTIQRIIDGTSNTIMIAEANPKAAVIWTKPDDLVMDSGNLMKDLRGQPNDGFCSVFCDGHAMFLKTSIDPKTFLHLLQMNDGQPIGEF